MAADDAREITARINSAPDIDIFLPIGGASVGDHDLMRPAFAAAGFSLVFSRVRVKPGRPTWFSTRGAQCALDLPGNPASAFVCAHIFLRPLMAPHDVARLTPLPLAAPLPRGGDRDDYLRARVDADGKGGFTFRCAADQDSSPIRPFLSANALVVRPAGDEARAAGDLVMVRMIAPL